ncbi:MAG: hypothetical protein LBS04_02780 [Tannerellaceae bacterium]|jgi:hypothetical protein|nr:hypothetical protein [Tannerellaceae bacterium]
MNNSGLLTEALLSVVRQWHGSIDEQFSCIDNVTFRMGRYAISWPLPDDVEKELTDNHEQLDVLIKRCRTTAGSAMDRALRNTLLKSTVALCLIRVKIWAYAGYAAGKITADEVHELGFLLPGETGGQHKRAEPTTARAEVKVSVLNEDFIRVVIDQSAGENAAQVVHGWPGGVGHALIVITSVAEDREVYRQMTTHLHNNIRLPEGSHGQQFVIKAAFLTHVDDDPIFGSSPTFSMPFSTEDLAAHLDRQHHEDFEAQVQEVERQRLEIERLRSELNAGK